MSDWKCPKCGAEIEWGDQHCRSCGMKIWFDPAEAPDSVRSATYHCSKCGASISWGDKCCRGCGKALDWGEADTWSRPPRKSNPSVPAGASNGLAVTALVLGLLSVPFFETAFVPLLAVVFSGIGLSRAGTLGGKGRAMAGWGLALGILGLIAFVASASLLRVYR